jgi:formate transporter
MTKPYIYTSDAYSPKEIAEKVEDMSVLKANARFLQTFMLGVLAGGFIGMGGLFMTFIAADTGLGDTGVRLLGGMFFATGYLLAILAGAEVFTSNNLFAMAVASGKIRFHQLLRNWGIVLVANAIGAFGLVVLFLLSGLHTEMGGQVGVAAYEIGVRKIELGLIETLARAILGNLFVCLAVWITLGGRSMADKVLGALFPLTALGALSLEHVTASLYFIPRSWLLAKFYPEYTDGVAFEVGPQIFLTHYLPVIAGNIIGGSFMVATVYYVIYRRMK